MKISSKVARVIKAENISPEELSYMLEHSSISSLRDGCNRRYFHWLLKVDKGNLLDMQHEQIVEVGEGESRMLEDHDACHGEGCLECGWVGKVGRWISDKKIPAHEPLIFR